MTQTRQTESKQSQEFKVAFKDGSTVTITARSERHARAAVSRGRKVGRYSGQVVSVETVKETR